MVPFGFEYMDRNISVLTEQEYKHGEKNFFSNHFSSVNLLTPHLQSFISPVTYILMEEATSLDTGQHKNDNFVYMQPWKHTHTRVRAHSKCFCTHISWNHLSEHLIGLYHIWKHLDKQGHKPAANGQSEKVQQLAFRFFILPPALKTFRYVYVGAEMDSCQCVCLG